MDSSQPYFTLHNGQIMLVNAPKYEKEKAMLDGSFYFDDDDDMSMTSSTLSESTQHFNNDVTKEYDDDDVSLYSSDEEEEVDLDVPSTRPNKLGGIGRSSISLDAYFQQRPVAPPAPPQEDKNGPIPRATASMPTISIPQQMVLSRTKSMASAALAQQLQMKNAASSGMFHAWQHTSAQEGSLVGSGPATAALDQMCKPDEHLAGNILQLGGSVLKTVSFDQLKNYFLQTTPEITAAWDAELLRAIRNHDLARVKEMHRSGKPLQACNQFGESILHVCVRRGTPEILKFLLDEGGVTPRVCCDYGRTPLADAAWVLSDNPTSFEIMGLLLERCPEMLLITDRRGFTSLDYVPKNQWAACCHFLDEHAELLRQRLKKTKA